MESHDLISRELIPRPVALQFFQSLATSETRQLDTAIDWVQSATIRLSLSDCVRDVETFAQKKGVKIPNASEILEALFSLEGLRCSLRWSGPTLLQYLIDEATKEEALPKEFDQDSFKKSLSRFFSASEKLERTFKAQKIYDGLLPNFESCSSLVEFRPVFDEAREHIVNGIVTATMTIQTRSPESEMEFDYSSFQLDASDVDEITEELNRIKRKLVAIKHFAEPQTQLLNPTKSLQSRDE
jgi:hypothetical protein